jgi:GH24 family phage-related lysozyme (muramidase)
MARIPLQLASRGLDTGSPVSYSGADPVGQALEGLGNTLGNFADHQRALAERAQAQKDDVEGFETNQRYLQLKMQADADRAEIGKNTPASGLGFHDSSVAAFDKRKNEFLGTVPERLKPRMAALLDTERVQFSQQSAEAEYKQRTDWYRTGLTTAVGQGQEQVFNDPSSLEAAKQEAFRAVDASGLPEAEKEEWRQKVKVGLSQSLAEREIREAAAVPVDLGVAASRLGVSDGRTTGGGDAAAVLRKFEGFKDSPYWDVNALRAGYGSDSITGPDGSVRRVKAGDTVSREDAERDLSRRAKSFEAGNVRQVGGAAWNALPPNAQAALVSVAYNYGSLPRNVVTAVQTGDVEAIASSVSALSGHNDGVNADRRRQEAAIIRGQQDIEGGVPHSAPIHLDPAYADLPLSQRLEVYDKMAAASARRIAAEKVQLRVGLDTAMSDAPVAIQNTGEYSGNLPTEQDFVTVYGADEGFKKAEEFQASIETSRSVHAMQTQSNADIQALLQEAKPTSSGPGADLEQRRYTSLATAAAQTIKARDADPAGYVMQAFPEVEAAWEGVRPGTPEFTQAVRTMQHAESQLGIPAEKMRFLPQALAEQTVEGFKDTTRTQDDRSSTLMGAVFATSDPKQRQAIFNQLVEAGLPETTEGAIEAAARGDQAAANRLFQAAMVNPADLPGKSPEKPSDINDTIQSELMAEGEIGDIYYGLSDGSADNMIRAQRDAKLLYNAVEVRLRNGEDLTSAVNAVGKDLYGNVQVVNETNAQILLGADEDADAVVSGLDRALPDVRASLDAALTITDPAVKGSQRAIADAATSTYKDRVLAEGYFRNADGGYVFIDPITGGAVSDAGGKPVIFQPKAAAVEAPVSRATFGGAPEAGQMQSPMEDTAPLTDDAFTNFQQRMGAAAAPAPAAPAPPAATAPAAQIPAQAGKVGRYSGGTAAQRAAATRNQLIENNPQFNPRVPR